MPISPTPERVAAWDVMSQFWVDTWYDEQQLDQFAQRLAALELPLGELDRIVGWDICGAFATFTLGVFLSAGMALPDWYFPEEEARARISTWLAKPRLLSFANPLWVMGYVAARRYIRKDWRDLRARVRAALGNG